MRFEGQGLEQAFRRMDRTAKEKGKALADEQAGFFLGMARKLGWAITPTKEKLDEIGEFLGNRLKRKKGITPEQEIARRKRMRGTFAKGWKIWKVIREPYRIRIWLWDVVGYSRKVDEEKKVSEKASEIVGGRFKTKLRRLADQVTKSFNG